ncbi:lipoprotein [Streptococcus pneumoniae]|uniref:hypothetical protein n=1 Tax=Streptococcus pneumoniae TaxID=1313 RepID=UPI0005E57758|nr:hypothetical protein [Streptococcus pneumoniae]COD61085.1 lipoprotein [Streptococcus pneumoniae]
MKQFVQFYKKDFLAVLVYFILLLSCVLSSTVYLLRCRQYSIHPNVLEWILVLLQDMTTGVYCFPFTYILFFFYLMNNYFNRLECRIRLKSIKHFTSFSFKLAALSTGIWTATLFLLIFLTTHDMNEATLLCDYVALLNKGKLVEQGAPSELIQRYNKDKKIKVTDYNGNQITFDFTSLEQVSQADLENIFSIHSCEPTLEDIFITLTGGKLNA